MNTNKEKLIKRKRRHARVRAKISGTKSTPRLSVYKSNKGMYIQLIDDLTSTTLVSAHSREVKAKGTKKDISFELGKIIAQKAIDNKIENVVFDKGGYRFHGRIKSLADGAREGGLKF